MADVKFVPNEAGIREIMKSSGVQAELLNQAQIKADEANAEAEGYKEYLHIQEFKTPPYGAHVDVLNNTAVGAAHTRTSLSHRLQAKFQILDSTNH